MFDDLHDPHPPAVGIDALASVAARARRLRRRRALLGGGGTAVLALAVTVVVLPGRGGERLVDVAEPATAASTSESASSTEPTGPGSAPSTAEPSSPELPAPDDPVDPSTTDPCRDVPSPPVWLVDGSSPGEATIESLPDGTMVARWGPTDGASVAQVAPDPAVGSFEEVAGTAQLVAAGAFRAAVVPIGDPAVGEIGITLDDGTCERQYAVGPDVELDEAIAYAQDWVDALEFDATAAVRSTPSSICVSVGASDVGCLDHEIPPNLAFELRRVPGTSLWLLLAAVPDGRSVAEPSTLVRLSSVDRASYVHVVDVIRSQTCTGVRTADGRLIPVGIDCDHAPDDPPVEPPVAAIDANGDVVVFDAFGVTLIFDGADPDDPPPPDGEVTTVDGVALTADGATALVGTCCEPVPGNLVRVDLGTGSAEGVGFGRLPAATRFGNIVWASLGNADTGELAPVVQIGDEFGDVASTLHAFPVDSAVVDLAVVPEPSGLGDAVLVLLATPDGVELRRLLAGGGDMQLSRPISTVPWSEDARLSLAGYSADSFFVLDDANDRLLEFDGATLEPVAVPDLRTLEISMWVTPDARRGVGEDRRLVIDGVEFPGEYLWVR